MWLLTLVYSHLLHNSANGAGYRMGITSQTFIPLTVANPAESEEIISLAEQEVNALKMSGSLPPGLSEQYDIQIENFKNPSLPDHQVMVMPGSYPLPCTCSSLHFNFIILT
jgi:hypothetical protein